jgi:NET1-associated nuclear protein 1 (U3 small nucleolar RNA-associated protein 17)
MISFLSPGCHFYSGAGECVLVKWTLDKPLDRGFLPRLPTSICHLSMGPNNKYLAISTSDNGEFGYVLCPVTKLIHSS